MEYTALKQLDSNKHSTKRTLLLTLLCLLISACNNETSHSQNTPNQTITTDTEDNAIKDVVTADEYIILAIGDSLTEGLNVNKNANYPAQLQQALHEKGYKQVKVVNSGLSGETSSGLKNRLDWVLQIKPDLTILNIGANDAIRGLPLDLTAANINNIIERIKASGSDVVLAGMEIYDNLGPEYVEGFKSIYPKMADEHQVPLIPFFLEHVAGDAQYNQADMIHPTAEGYTLIVNRNIMPVIQPIVSQHLNNPLRSK
ncbi:arylesterase [Marinicella sp. S1101]|uniref:arylesterase n=1 Tax=Marinicella marina TaxID=2996016 RepID=UPI002260D464|nr:arylesterase [Marinicella marina]MCX7554831.1 arylesterase [Marinicella marina]MDJ1140936.1 arylesterase [Marinicella marina]